MEPDAETQGADRRRPSTRASRASRSAAATGWPVKFAAKVAETPRPPTEEELSVLRDLHARTKAAHQGKRDDVDHDAPLTKARTARYYALRGRTWRGSTTDVYSRRRRGRSAVALSGLPQHGARSPKQPLIIIPQTLSEITGPVYGHSDVKPEEADLTTQHAGEPLGERIIVKGRVLDEAGRPVPQHAGRDLAVQRRRPLHPRGRPAPRAARSQLHRRRPLRHRRQRQLPVHHHQARRLSLGQPPQRLAAGAHPLLAVRARRS